MTLRFVFIAALLAVTCPADALADAVRYTPDRWHTRIYFTISHMGLSNYQGRFVEYDFDFMLDEDNFANSSIEVTVPIASIDTFSPELTSKMPDELFFHSEQFPTAHFVSTSIEMIDDDSARMTGEITIKGVTREVTFDVTYNGKVFHPFYFKNNVGFTATGEVDSREFGVNALPEWMVGSAVQLRIEMEAFEGDEVPYYSD